MTDPAPEAIPWVDWDRLSVPARSLLCLIAALREGRLIEEAAVRMQEVVDGVVEHIEETDKGDAKGPKGTITITLQVGPNVVDPKGETVEVIDKLANKYPQDRSHVVFVRKGSTLFTRESTADKLFALRPDHDTGDTEIVYPPDRAAGPDD